MEPETPSRRKKTGDEPVTIDLEAVPASVSNEALAAGEKAEASAQEPEATETAAAETATPESTVERGPLLTAIPSLSSYPAIAANASSNVSSTTAIAPCPLTRFIN